MCETGIMFMLPVTYRSQRIGMDSDLYCVPHSVLTIWEDNGLLFWKICPSHFQQAHFIGLSAVGTEAVSVLGSGLSSGQVASHICKTCDACLSPFPLFFLLFYRCLGPAIPSNTVWLVSATINRLLLQGHLGWEGVRP